MKVLLDALRMPTKEELAVQGSPKGPTYCLMQNDTLVSGLEDPDPAAAVSSVHASARSAIGYRGFNPRASRTRGQLLLTLIRFLGRRPLIAG